MDLNEKNGQPSMEEILASIRRIIAEEPTATNPVIDLHAKYKPKAELEDSNDFELPSIFRPNPAATTNERQPLFGRLTDAIRNASGGAPTQDTRPSRAETGEPAERYKGGLRDASGGMFGAGETGANGGPAPAGDADRYRGALRDSGAGTSSLSSALSSLKLTRGEAERKADAQASLAGVAGVAPAPVAPAPTPAPAPVQVASGPAEDVRRVMVPFKDMRMSRMASVESPVEVPPPAPPVFQPQVAPAPMPVAPFAPQAASAPGFSNPEYPSAPTGPADSLSLDDMHRFAPVFENPAFRPSPPPVPVAESAPASGIEDATADLLRPMLRQWLSENMPRMVEKALSIELAESVRVNRKFTGQ